MFKFIDYSDISLLLEQVCKEQSLNLLQVLSDFLRHDLDPSIILKESITQISDLEKLINTDDLFGDPAPNIIDLQNIKLGQSEIDFVKNLNLQNIDKNLIFIDQTQNSLTLEVKKLWQKSGLEYLELKKPDLKVKQSLALEYSSKIGLNLSSKDLSDISSSALTYTEVLDNLDLIALSDDQKQSLQDMIKEAPLLLFMFGFDTNNLPKSVGNWYKHVYEEDVQLALSLVFGKLEKSKTPKNKKLQAELIKTDLDIKTSTKLSMLYRWRLFLWKAQNST